MLVLWKRVVVMDADYASIGSPRDWAWQVSVTAPCATTNKTGWRRIFTPRLQLTKPKCRKKDSAPFFRTRILLAGTTVAGCTIKTIQAHVILNPKKKKNFSIGLKNFSRTTVGSGWFDVTTQHVGLAARKQSMVFVRRPWCKDTTMTTNEKPTSRNQSVDRQCKCESRNQSDQRLFSGIFCNGLTLVAFESLSKNDSSLAGTADFEFCSIRFCSVSCPGSCERIFVGNFVSHNKRRSHQITQRDSIAVENWNTFLATVTRQFWS